MSKGLVAIDESQSFTIDPVGAASLEAIKGPVAVVACQGNATAVLERAHIFSEPPQLFSQTTAPGIRMWTWNQVDLKMPR